MSAWNFVTDFGDSAVTVPLALLVLVSLVARGQRRLACGWGLAVGGCAATMGALKLLFGACGGMLASNIVSPSGHTAMSAGVYGALALLVGVGQPSWRRKALYLIVAACIAAIGWSRVVLHDHTPAEVAIGLAVGSAAVLLFRAMLGQQDAPVLPLKWLAVCGAALVVVMHGTRWMVEPAVHRLAWDFRLILPWCR